MRHDHQLRQTRCPLCARTVWAELLPGTPHWHFRSHATNLVDGVWCRADDGEWRLFGQFRKAGGSWDDHWVRPNDALVSGRSVKPRSI